MDGAFGHFIDPDPPETMAQASARTGIPKRTLGERAKRLGLPVPPVGRPRFEQPWTRLQSEWDRCATMPRLPPGRCLSKGEWTRAEDATLRRLTARPVRGRLLIDWPALLAALPRHTKSTIQTRRAALGLTRAPAWSDRQREVLRRKFGRVSRATLLEMLRGKSWGAIVKQAKADGVTGLPAGKMLLSTAARKFGYHVATFRALLARHGVRVVNYTCNVGHAPARVPWKYVSVTACHRAVKADIDMETVAMAARRLGVPRKTLRAWMIATGHSMEGRRGQWTRFAPAALNAVAQANGHRAGGESIGHAARRHGLDATRMRRWLREAGLVTPTARGHRLWLNPKSVDVVVNERRGLSVEGARV